MPPSQYAAVAGVSRAIEGLDVEGLREAIRDEYAQVATNPEQGFHFHTGRRLAGILGYDDQWLDSTTCASRRALPSHCPYRTRGGTS